MDARKIKLIALDMDGTLLNNHHELTEYSIGVLRRLSAAGVTIAFATGRSVPNIERYVKELNLPQPVFPAVCYNGAIGIIIDKEDKRSIIADNQVSREAARLVIDFSIRNGFVAHYYNAINGEVYAVPTTDNHRALLDRYANLVGKKQILCTSYDEAFSLSVPAKILVLDDDSEKVIKRAKEQLPDGIFNIFRGSPHPYFVEFLDVNAAKGHGLKQMCDYLNIDAANVLAFGDGENDKEMLEYAGIGIAMKNATAVAKQAADQILEWANDEDGVARQLEKFEQLGYFA